MAEKPASPFARLDTGLLRSTKPQQQQRPEAEPASAQVTTPAAVPATPEPRPEEQAAPSTQAGQPRRQARPRATPASRQASPPRAPDETPDEVVERIRKVVKTQGKEVSFIRLTPEEKGQLADVVYTYKRQGRRTTENEITRIAVTYLLEEYRSNGKASLLARVLDALHA